MGNLFIIVSFFILIVDMYLLFLNNRNTKKKWLTMLIISLIPYLVLLAYGIDSFINGYSIFTLKYYGFYGMYTTIFLMFLFMWYIFVPALLFVIISIVKMIKLKK